MRDVLRSRRLVGSAGQATSETILMLPLYLALVFGLLQLCQLGVALVMVNTAASKIARLAVQVNAAPSGVIGLADSLKPYLTVGMIPVGVWGCPVQDNLETTSLTPTITVNAAARVNAFPLVGWFLKPALHTNYSGSTVGPGACPSTEPPSLGPFYFNGTPPYYFIVRGRATVRMNYHPS